MPKHWPLESDNSDFTAREGSPQVVRESGEDQMMAAGDGASFPIREPHPLAEGAD